MEFIPHGGLLGYGPTRGCDPACQLKVTILHGDRKSVETEQSLSFMRTQITMQCLCFELSAVTANEILLYLCVYEGCKRKVVKEVGEIFPNICISIFSQALVIKAVNLCDLSAFMISTEDGDSLSISNLDNFK